MLQFGFLALYHLPQPTLNSAVFRRVLPEFANPSGTTLYKKMLVLHPN